jgi:ribosome-associated protein
VAGYHTGIVKTANRLPVMEQPLPRADRSRMREGPSKSQRKRDSHALQDLGEQLVGLPAARLAELALPEPLRDAIEEARGIRSREALRRQLQRVGKLMREVDPEPIRDALAVDGNRHRAEVARMHSAEHWRDRMLAEPDAVGAFAAEHPALAAAAPWSTLIAQARAEHAAGQPPRRARELYRALHAAFAAPAPAPAAEPPTAAD